MKINKVYIKGFGKLKDYGIEFEDGFQIIGAENEFGKTTIMEFINMMFYGKKGGGQNILKNSRLRYRPWNGEEMAGMIEFEHDNIVYRIEKEFGKSPSTDRQLILNLSNDTKIEIPSEMDVGMYFFGMDADAFERSLFIKQSRMEYKQGDKDYIMENIGRDVMWENDGEDLQKALERIKLAREEIVSKSGRSGRITELKKEKSSLEKELAKALRKNEQSKEKIKESDEIRNALEAAALQESIERIDVILSEETFEENKITRLSKKWIFIMIISALFIFAGIRYNILFMAGVLVSVLAGVVFNNRYTGDSSIEKRASQERLRLLNEKNKIYVSDKYENMTINRLRTELEKCERNIEPQTDTEYIEDKISKLKDKISDMSEYYDALVHAETVLRDIENDKRRDYTPELNKRAGEIFGYITSGKYDKVMVGKDYNPLVTENGDYKSIQWQYLSRGTIDQMYLSVRLAISESITGREAYPVFMDDVLETYDDERLEETIKYLKKMGKNTQIILFTCHGSVLRMGR